MAKTIPRLLQTCFLQAVCFFFCLGNAAFGQAYGVELHNTVMPASGAMGGTSVAQPQDLLSAINGNPATLSQFHGTQFSFGGAFVGPTVKMDYQGNSILPGLGPYSATSGFPGSSLPNIGITQDFNARGLPVTTGVALVSTAGLGIDYAAAPGSNRSNVLLQVINLKTGMSIQLTDRLSAGSNFSLGLGLFEGLFIGSSKATPSYGVRSAIGFDYDINTNNKAGLYFQTKQNFEFEDAVSLELPNGSLAPPVDIDLSMPPNLALGFSNTRFADGRLLLAADFLYKFWENTDLFSAIYKNQFVLQMGAQYSFDRAKFRLGYAWAENGMIETPGVTIGGISPPGATRALQYIQGLAPNINGSRFSGGIGVPDVLPGVDFDLFAGGMFESTETFGDATASVVSYYLGGGLTWRFGRGSGSNLAPNQWCDASADCGSD